MLIWEALLRLRWSLTSDIFRVRAQLQRRVSLIPGESQESSVVDRELPGFLPSLFVSLGFVLCLGILSHPNFFLQGI